METKEIKSEYQGKVENTYGDYFMNCSTSDIMAEYEKQRAEWVSLEPPDSERKELSIRQEYK